MASGDKMADFYPLIVKAVTALAPDPSGESRRVLYDRVRAALLAELRIAEPPFTEFQIMHERLALEDAVRRVEEEATERDREEVTAFDDLAVDAGDLAVVASPPMIVSGNATGSLNAVWRLTLR
jgi:hypothetical protein